MIISHRSMVSKENKLEESHAVVHFSSDEQLWLEGEHAEKEEREDGETPKAECL